MHIVYSDGLHIVEDLPPKEESTPEHTVLNAVGSRIINSRMIDKNWAGLYTSTTAARPTPFLYR